MLVKECSKCYALFDAPNNRYQVCDDCVWYSRTYRQGRKLTPLAQALYAPRKKAALAQ